MITNMSSTPIPIIRKGMIACRGLNTNPTPENKKVKNGKSNALLLSDCYKITIIKDVIKKHIFVHHCCPFNNILYKYSITKLYLFQD